MLQLYCSIYNAVCSLPTLSSSRWHCSRGVPRCLFILLAICQWRKTTLFFICLKRQYDVHTHTCIIYIVERCTYSWDFISKCTTILCHATETYHCVSQSFVFFSLHHTYNTRFGTRLLISYFFFSFSSLPQHPIVCTFSLFIFVFNVNTFFIRNAYAQNPCCETRAHYETKKRFQ